MLLFGASAEEWAGLQYPGGGRWERAPPALFGASFPLKGGGAMHVMLTVPAQWS